MFRYQLAGAKALRVDPSWFCSLLICVLTTSSISTAALGGECWSWGQSGQSAWSGGCAGAPMRNQPES